MSEKNTEYETIQIDMSDDDFLRLAKIAHEHDITFNQLVNRLLMEYIETVKVDTDKV